MILLLNIGVRLGFFGILLLSISSREFRYSVISGFLKKRFCAVLKDDFCVTAVWVFAHTFTFGFGRHCGHARVFVGTR